MPVSRDTGRLLYMLARATAARTIVEFGTSFGVSTLHLAAALRDNGGGRLIRQRVRAREGGPRARQSRPPAASPIWSRSARATRWRRWASVFPTRSICCCSTAPSRSTARCWAWSNAGACPPRSFVADNADCCPDYLEHIHALGQLAICRCRSPRRSSCRCGSVRPTS